MKDVKEEIKWHDAPGDLEKLGNIQDEFRMLYYNNDVPKLFLCINAYYMELEPMTNMKDEEKSKIETELRHIAHTIKQSDLNQDGHLDEYEQQRASQKLAEAKIMIEKLYSYMKKIKVKNGLSVSLQDFVYQMKTLKKYQYLSKWIDTEIFKGKGDLELIYLQKLSQGYVKQ